MLHCPFSIKLSLLPIQLNDSWPPPHQYNALEKSGPQIVRYHSNSDSVRICCYVVHMQ